MSGPPGTQSVQSTKRYRGTDDTSEVAPTQKTRKVAAIVRHLLSQPESEILPGLFVVSDFISTEEETELLRMVDEQHWSNELQRRVQQYGYSYDYKASTVSKPLGSLPQWLEDLSRRMRDTGLVSQVFDQVIVNEYQPGQGIAPHVDKKADFMDQIVMLSLGSAVDMDFYQKRDTKMTKLVSIRMFRRSACLLQGESRYAWAHGIAPRKNDKHMFSGRKIARARRISLTFRTVRAERKGRGGVLYIEH